MDVRRALLTVPVTRPLTAPVTTVTTARHRRNSGRFRATRETTIWGRTPNILPPEQPNARSLL
jgi:hypothetical protein